MAEIFFKNKILLLLVLFSSVISNAQISVYGDWRINDIMGYRELKEYSMIRQDDKNPWE